MRTRTLLVALLTMTLLGVAAPVRGGGISVDGVDRDIASGASVTPRVAYSFDSPDLADAAAEQGPYRLVLVRGTHFWSGIPRQERPLVRRAVGLGRLELDLDAPTVRLRGRFTVPAIAPGPYTMVVCDAGCDGSLGNLLSTPVDVYATTSDVVLAGRVRRLDQRLANARYRLRRRLRHDVEALERDLALGAGQVAGQIRGLDRRMTDAENRLQRQGVLAARPATATAAGVWALGGLAVLLAVVALGVALRPRATPDASRRAPQDEDEPARVS